MRPIDLTGNRYGMLTVISLADAKGRKRRWSCVCDCGGRSVVSGSNLRNGHTSSCGCTRNVHSEYSGKRASPELAAYRSMLSRCGNRNSSRWESYGGRGIRVCDRWAESFSAFLADMGRRPTTHHSLDRIDVNGNYEPGNCRWATSVEQNTNKRTNHVVEANGSSLTVSQWVRRTGVKKTTLLRRLAQGVDPALAVCADDVTAAPPSGKPRVHPKRAKSSEETSGDASGHEGGDSSPETFNY